MSENVAPSIPEPPNPPEDTSEIPVGLTQGGLKIYFAGVGILLVLGTILAFARFPVGVYQPLSLLTAALFVAIPIAALFFGAASKWTWAKAGIFIAVGVALHVFGAFSPDIFGLQTGHPVTYAIVTLGLLFWCMGLGAALAILIREPNLMIPVALFLIGFDIFLVFAPVGTANIEVIDRSEFFENVAYTIPAAQPIPVDPDERRVAIEPIARIGPADLFFSAAFFTMLFRFKLRPITTVKWLIPVLAGYLMIVLFMAGVRIGPFYLGALPALVPIGLTVLLVNRDKFKMNATERSATIGIGVLSLLLAVAGLILAVMADRRPQEPQPDPLQSPGVQLPPELADSPLPPIRD